MDAHTVRDRCHPRCASCVMHARCCGLPAYVPPCLVAPTHSRLWRPPLAIILLPPCHNCVQPQLKVWLAVCRLVLRDSVVLHYLAPQPARNVSCLTTHLLPQVLGGGACWLLVVLHVLTTCCESPANDYVPLLQVRGCCFAAAECHPYTHCRYQLWYWCSCARPCLLVPQRPLSHVCICFGGVVVK